MPMRDRRRPSPIEIVPRQEPSATGLPSPETPGDSPSPTGGPESPDSPSPTNASFEPPSPTEASKPAVSSTDAAASITSAAPAPPAAASTTAAPAIGSAAASSVAASSAPVASVSSPVASSAPSSIINVPLAPSQASSQASSAVQSSSKPTSIQVTISTSAAPAVTAPTNPNGNGNNSNFSSQKAQPEKPSTSAIDPSPAQSDTAGSAGTAQPQKFKHEHGINGMSKGAEAALITCSVLGAIALIVGLIFFFRRRRRRHQSELRHAEDAFNPSNTGSLSHPETSAFARYSSHFTRSTTTTSLFAADPNHRPETVSTNTSQSNSRIQAPQPTPNPFADPPLNKAYDVLRGRPRSTTLTDRGSWVQNPFKDPASERFDPFGELQEKARQERKRYLEDVAREDAVRREQQFLEKERMGLGVPGTFGGLSAGRKGSGVTVEGVGILDRSGEGRYAR